MHIRTEQASDLQAIRDIVHAAFAEHPYSAHNEERIVDALRAADALCVSLVAVEGGGAIGYVACSSVTIDGRDCGWYGLGPVAVRPDRQRSGCGSALMLASIEQLRRVGAAGIVLLGEPAYYQRFGFRAHCELVFPGARASHFLSLPLRGEVPAGTVSYHSAFFVQ